MYPISVETEFYSFIGFRCGTGYNHSHHTGNDTKYSLLFRNGNVATTWRFHCPDCKCYKPVSLQANDIDSHPHLSYAFLPGGNPGNLFSVDKFSGRLLVAAKLDRESKVKHSITISASDGAHTVHTELTINLQVCTWLVLCARGRRNLITQEHRVNPW